MSTNSENGLILLCFRGAKHYWPLCIRQLHLFPGLEGESFPYRSEFVWPNAVEVGKIYPKGLICMKFDSSDMDQGIGQIPLPLYIPLRFVERVDAELASSSSMFYFRYLLGRTVDYGKRQLDGYSSEISAAVLQALRAEDKGAEDEDKNLVVRIPTPLGLCDEALSPNEETDRWIALTKQLALEANYAGLKERSVIHSRYQGICYSRISEVERLDSAQKPGFSSVGGRVELELFSESTYRVETITNLSSQLSLENPCHYVLSFDRELFDVVDNDAELSKGVLRHEFLVRCRKPATHTQIKLSPKDVVGGIHIPDLVLPLKILATIRTRFFEFGPVILVGMGIVLAMLATFASSVQATISPLIMRIVSYIFGTPGVWVLHIILLNFSDEIKALLKFGAIVLSSSGGGLAFWAERRYKLPISK